MEEELLTSFLDGGAQKTLVGTTPERNQTLEVSFENIQANEHFTTRERNVVRLTNRVPSSHFVNTVLDYDRSLQFADVELRGSEGRTSFPANAIVLSAWSPLLHGILFELDIRSTPLQRKQSSSSGVVVIFDEAPSDLLQELLSLMYTGCVKSSRSDGGQSFQHVLNSIGVQVGLAEDGTSVHLEKLHLLSKSKQSQRFNGNVPSSLPQQSSAVSHSVSVIEMGFGAVKRDPSEQFLSADDSLKFEEDLANDAPGDSDIAEDDPTLVPLSVRRTDLAESKFSAKSSRSLRLKMKKRLLCRKREREAEELENAGELRGARRVIRRRKVDKLDASNHGVKLKKRKAISTNQEEIETHVEPLKDGGNVKQNTAAEHSCCICQETFDSKRTLLEHRKTHTPHCRVCDRSFKNLFVLRDHVKFQHGIVRYECAVCKRCFKLKTDLENHQNTHLGVKKYNCSNCDRGFNRAYLWRQHMQTHLGNPFQCNKCLKQFPVKQNLDQHYCGDTPRPHICAICQKGFGTKALLDQHANVHTGANLYSCSVCNKKFAFKASWKYHMDCHRERKFVCEICARAFVQKQQLERHALIHSQGGQPKRFKCHICGLGCATNGNLIVHLRIHTGEKPFSCEVCHKSFRTRDIVKRHMIYHQEKEHQCHICLRKYCTKQILNDHIRTHTGEKPFSCVVCLEKFTSSSLLSIHKRKHK